MKFTLERKHLRGALDKLVGFIPPGSNEEHNTVSLLLVEGQGFWTLDMATEGSDASFQTALPAQDVEESSDGDEVLIYGKLLIDIAKRAHSDTITFDVNFDEGFLEIVAGDTRWRTPFLIRSITRNEPAKETSRVSSDYLSEVLSKTKHAVGGDSGRPYLMILEISGNLVQACNGVTYHELAIESDMNLSLRAGIVVSLLQLLKSWDGEIVIGENDEYYTLQVNSDLLTLSKPKSNFPDLHAMLVKPMKSQVPSLLKVDKKVLRGALEEVKLLSSSDLPCVDMTMTENSVLLKCSRKNGAESTAKIPAYWSGPVREATFEIAALQDLISSVEDDKLELRFGKDGKSANSPMVVEGDGSWLMLNQMKSK
ncbi:MAG: hypothetical protein NWE76_03390 [Candidatus Bathyarchaeota archaeon]|nr:hypothetical protein [Candidatus Bathyarchaeota archaeon]